MSSPKAYHQHGKRKREVIADEAKARKRARHLRDTLADVRRQHQSE